MSWQEAMQLGPYKLLLWCLENERVGEGHGPVSTLFTTIYGIRVRTTDCVCVKPITEGSDEHCF